MKISHSCHNRYSTSEEEYITPAHNLIQHQVDAAVCEADHTTAKNLKFFNFFVLSIERTAPARIILTLDWDCIAFQTRPMLTRRDALCLFALAPLSACVMSGIPGSARTTIILLRHADRTGDNLNSFGVARSENLPNALAGYQLSAIFSPDIPRNLETAKPLSQATGLPITVIPKEFAGSTMSRAYPNGTVVWIGNKGNLRTIWEELGVPGTAPQEYGEIGIVTLLPDGGRQVERLVVNA